MIDHIYILGNHEFYQDQHSIDDNFCLYWLNPFRIYLKKSSKWMYISEMGNTTKIAMMT